MMPANGGFWDLPPDARQAACDAACDRYGVGDFFDLDAADRAAVYDRAAAEWYGRIEVPS